MTRHGIIAAHVVLSVAITRGIDWFQIRVVKESTSEAAGVALVSFVAYWLGVFVNWQRRRHQ